jgi:ATP-binding cassette subfamily F protein 3
VEIWNKQMHFYAGNYDQYLAGKKRAQRAARIRLQDAARPHRAARSLHQPLPLHGDQGQAGAEPHQRTGKDRADRDSEEEKTVHFSFPQPKPSGRIVAEFANVAKSYGEPGINEHKVFEKVIS